jgi:hypoxanthine phosphoribosyltransferase
VEREEYIYPFEEYDNDCKRIAEWAKDKGFKNIYGVCRGGWTPTVRLSHLLLLPIVRYEENITRDTLIVEDLIHDGDTMERLFNVIGKRENFRIAVLFYKKDAKIRPDFFAREWIKWVRFPWETKESSRRDNAV